MPPWPTFAPRGGHLAASGRVVVNARAARRERRVSTRDFPRGAHGVEGTKASLGATAVTPPTPLHIGVKGSFAKSREIVDDVELPGGVEDTVALPMQPVWLTFGWLVEGQLKPK